MGTPNAADQYSRFMVELFDQRNAYSIPTAFQSFFGNPAGGGLTIFERDQGILEIDIIKADGEKLAELVHRGQSSNAVDNSHITDYEFSNVGRKWLLAESLSNINSAKLLDRGPGDSPYARRTQLDRARQKARDLHFEHIRRQSRLWEFLARESIMTGKQPVILGTTNSEWFYDFYRLPTHTIGVPIPWDNGSQDILLDLDNALTLVEVDSGRVLDFLGLGGDAMRAFIKDTTVAALADNRRFELIQVSQTLPVPPEFARFVQNGWTAYGLLRTPYGRTLWIFTNSKTFTDSAGSPENYMPLDKALLLSSSARFDRYYGPRDRLPITPMEAQWYMQFFGFSMDAPPMPPNPSADTDIILPEAFYFDAFAPEDKKNVTMRTQSAPIFATTETDAIVVLEDLITPP